MLEKSRIAIFTSQSIMTKVYAYAILSVPNVGLISKDCLENEVG